MIRIISVITAALVLALALTAFVLSYDALRHVAVETGMSEQLSFLFPFVVDGFIIVATLSVLRSSVLAESAKFAWMLTGLSVALSVALNVSHAGTDDVRNVTVAATPPLALTLAFELFMSQIRSFVKRGEIKKSMSQLMAQRKSLSDTVEKMKRLSEQAGDRHKDLLAELRQERDTLRQENRRLSENVEALSQPDTRDTAIDRRRQRVSELVAEGVTVDDIADKLAVSNRTIYRDMKSMGIGRNDDGHN